MYVKINDEFLPENTLLTVSIALGGGVSITGDAIKEQDRLDISTIIGGIMEGDIVDFDVEDHNFVRLFGPGTIRLVEMNEEGLGDKLMRLKYTIAIERIR